MGLKDIRIPADASDKQTTDAKSALPPVEFVLTKTDTGNQLAIHDRQGPQDRVPTVSYRVYFLPQEFAPPSTGTTTTIPSPAVMRSITRDSGRRVASLVADVKAPALGTILNITDNVNTGAPGYYYCVGVNRNGVEAPPEHIVTTAGLNDVAATTGSGGGSGPPPIVAGLISINTDVTPAQTLSAGANITITDDGIGGHTIAATGGGGFTMENSSTVVDGIAVVFTFSTAVSANDAIFSDGRLMDEAIGDYTRLGATVTFAFAPISTAKRVF